MIYIFGYGSLINSYSLAATLLEFYSFSETQLETLTKFLHEKIFKKVLEINNSVQIVRIKGIKRGWFVHGLSKDIKNGGLSLTPTYLAAYPHFDGHCNGVLFPVTDEELERIDTRESEAGYIRTTLNNNDIFFLNNEISFSSQDKVFYYAIDESKRVAPCEDHPIIQSYVDICISGCIIIDNTFNDEDFSFTKEFILTTDKWNEHWINDRLKIYASHTYEPYKSQIDKLLSLYIDKNILTKIKID